MWRAIAGGMLARLNAGNDEYQNGSGEMFEARHLDRVTVELIRRAL